MRGGKVSGRKSEELLELYIYIYIMRRRKAIENRVWALDCTVNATLSRLQLRENGVWNIHRKLGSFVLRTCTLCSQVAQLRQELATLADEPHATARRLGSFVGG